MHPVAVLVEGFRGIDELALELLPINLIIGKNNVGKSTLLEALGRDPFGRGEEERLGERPERVMWTFDDGSTATAEPQRDQWAPEIITVYNDPDDISPRLAIRLVRLARQIWAPLAALDGEVESALSEMEHGRLGEALRLGLIQPLIQAAERLANSFAPGFLAAEGAIQIVLRQGPDGEAGKLRLLLDQMARDGASPELVSQATSNPTIAGETTDYSLDVEMAPIDGPATKYSHLGSGMRRWISAAIAEALRAFGDSLDDASWNPDVEALALAKSTGELPAFEATVRSQVILIDEPTLGLHPTAHADVFDWMVRRATERGDTVVAAAHHLDLFQGVLGLDQVQLVGLSRPSGTMKVETLPLADLGGFGASAPQYGFASIDAIAFARRMLVLEGTSDLQIIRHLFGRQLARDRIVLSHANGNSVSSVIGVIDNQIARLVNLPVDLMLDASTPTRKHYNRALEIVKECHKRGIDNITPVEFAADDILVALDLDQMLPLWNEHLGFNGPRSFDELAELAGKRRLSKSDLLGSLNSGMRAGHAAKLMTQAVLDHIPAGEESAAAPSLRRAMDAYFRRIETA